MFRSCSTIFGEGPSRLPSRRRYDRSGSLTVWVLVSMPVMLIMFFTVTTIGSLWLARTELINLADAAALAGAKVWGDGPDDSTNRTAAHLAAEALAEANTVLSTAPNVSANNNSGNTNNNDLCPGEILLGRYLGTTFAGGQVPAAVNERACRVSFTVNVTVPFIGGTGMAGPFTIQATSTAFYDGAAEGAGTPRLVYITAATCP